jgi:hypothetical protein
MGEGDEEYVPHAYLARQDGHVPGFPGPGGPPNQEIVLSAEVVDGEVVRDGAPDFQWEQWDRDRAVTNFKLRVSESWYQRVKREDWAELNELLCGLAELQRRTRRPGDAGPHVAT